MIKYVVGMFILGAVWQIDPISSIVIPICLFAGALYNSKENIAYPTPVKQKTPVYMDKIPWTSDESSPDFLFLSKPDYE